MRPIFLSILAGLAATGLAADEPRLEASLDGGWRFHLGPATGAEAPGFDDSGWRALDLPHDWSAEGEFNPKQASGTGFLPGGTGWYRKRFTLPAGWHGRQVAVEFDGVMRHSDVWVNGRHLGHRPSGYVGFRYDLTPHLRAAGVNVIAVRAQRENVADSRWYPGSGIYRHVRLVATGPLAVAPWGVFVTTPRITGNSADIAVTATIANQSGEERAVRVEWAVVGPQGDQVGAMATDQRIPAGGQEECGGWCQVPAPRLWSPEDPALHTLVTKVVADGKLVDETRVTFGIRSIRFDPAAGFFLNGKPTRIKGVCLHHDGGVVGAAVPAGVLERRLRLLMGIGANAVRCSHNPMAPEFYDICDRLGLLVMDEAFDEWEIGKRKWVEGRNHGEAQRFGYAEDFKAWAERDLADMVRQHRNHPSVILWSIGNEIDYPTDPYVHPQSRNDPDFDSFVQRGHPSVTRLLAVAPRLIATVKRHDPSRPVTMALANAPAANGIGLADLLDVAGYNYQEQFYDEDHRVFPGRAILGSENAAWIGSWHTVLDRPYIAGLFLWAGFDFLGEADRWPAHGSSAGLFDRCGFLKPNAFAFEAAWAARPVVRAVVGDAGRRRRLQAHWTFPEAGKPTLEVSVFTNCQEVELRLNGRVLGTAAPDRQMRARFRVDYQPGELVAVGRNGGVEAARDVLRTAGPPARLQLAVDASAPAPGSPAHVIVEVVDDKGVRVPGAAHQVAAAVDGPGRLLGLDNGDQTDPTPLRSPSRRARDGRLLAIVQSAPGPGPLRLRASAPGLPPAELVLRN